MKRKKSSVTITGIIYLLPALIFVIGFNVIPFVWNMILSLQNWNGFSQAEFVGLENFKAVLADSAFLHSLWNSILYAACSTVGGVLLGLVLATFIYKLGDKEGSVFRLILYSPAMVPTAVVGLMFVFFFNPEMGLLNNFLKIIGLESLQHVWLQDKATAMACLVFVAIWKCAGSVMMMCFASMQTLPPSLYESAKLDGASFWQQMFQITYPLIKPMILLSTINTLGSQYKSYDLIQTMTQGGPGNLTSTVPIIMTKTAFTYGKFGRAAAQGVIFTVIVAISIILVRRVLRSEEYEY
ncbi:MAG: sugar ABC transporter permease [Lachnospiraceae bacterium]|nr:sugar ABC transporter permease [Lachnospiraceae bacterium]